MLANHGVTADAAAMATLEGFRELRRQLDAQPTQFLDSRIRRFQSFAEISTELARISASALKHTPPDFPDP